MNWYHTETCSDCDIETPSNYQLTGEGIADIEGKQKANLCLDIVLLTLCEQLISKLLNDIN